MPHGERRDAAALLHVEALAAAPVEVAVPDVQVAVAYARAGDAHQHFAALGLWRLESNPLQGLAVLDDLIADHVLPRLTFMRSRSRSELDRCPRGYRRAIRCRPTCAPCRA